MADRMGNFKVRSSSSNKIARKNHNEENAIPLKQVVAECERQWFDQTLKAAKAGETAMQTLVGQMLCSGYGAPVNVKEVQFFFTTSTFQLLFCVCVLFVFWVERKCMWTLYYVCLCLFAIPATSLVEAAVKEGERLVWETPGYIMATKSSREGPGGTEFTGFPILYTSKSCNILCLPHPSPCLCPFCLFIYLYTIVLGPNSVHCWFLQRWEVASQKDGR